VTVQQQVSKLVAQRGYRHRWSANQFIARQIAKLAEELSELAQHVELPVSVLTVINTAGEVCRLSFHNPLYWHRPVRADAVGMVSELADIQVVLFCLAQEIAESTGCPFDVVSAALEKARTDTLRGAQDGDTRQV